MYLGFFGGVPMYQTWKKKLSALLLCGALLFTLCGCQRQKAAPAFPFDSKGIAYLETLYGKTLKEMAEEWDFSLESLVERPVGSGAWSMDKKVAIEGKDFTQTLMIDPDSGMFCGFEYSYYCDSGEELAQLTEAIHTKCLEEYGTPAYDPSSDPSSLSTEGVFEKMKTAKQGGGQEVWGRIGEISWFRMNIELWASEGIFCLRLAYRVVPEEWHRFVPGFEAPFALFPVEEEE